MSILIGVNDVWHEFEYQNGVENKKMKKFTCIMSKNVI